MAAMTATVKLVEGLESDSHNNECVRRANGGRGERSYSSGGNGGGVDGGTEGGGGHGGGVLGGGAKGGGGGGGDGGGAPKTTTITSAAAEMVSRVIPMALSSSATCASSMALSCAFDAADAASPLLPRKSV